MSTGQGVILYGPPASGKDTITRELHRLDARCVLFPRLKVGAGRREGYRFIDQNQLDQLTASGDIAWTNHRYSATYAVDISGLHDHLNRHVTILHLGQAEAIDAIRQAVPAARWHVVELWCPRDVTEARLVERDPSDVQRRLSAWDATDKLTEADQRIDTSTTPPADAARLILAAITSPVE